MGSEAAEKEDLEITLISVGLKPTKESLCAQNLLCFHVRPPNAASRDQSLLNTDRFDDVGRDARLSRRRLPAIPESAVERTEL